MTRHRHGALLSPAEVDILSLVIAHGPIRQRDLVALSSRNTATVSTAVKQLRTSGWVRGTGRAPVEVTPGAVVAATALALMPPRRRASR